MKRLAPVLALLIAACASTSGGGTTSPTASGGAASSIPSASSSPTPHALACKLPLAAGGAPVTGPSGGGTFGSGGFVTFPGGAFAVDLQSAGAYDRQQSRWLPTEYLAVSPDGSRYAYAEPAVANPGGGPPLTGSVHIVTVASGTDNIAHTPGPVAVAAWTATGVYVFSIIPQSDAGPIGLTVINPDTLVFHQITPTGVWLVMGSAYAYSTDVDPADPHPPQQTGPGPIPGNRVIRMDLSNGAITHVVTVNGARVQVIGLDSSQNPIVSANTSTAYTVQLTPTNRQIFAGPPIDGSGGNGDPLNALADSTGIWFNSISGEVWHYGPSDSVAQAMSNTGLNLPLLAGPCT